MRHVGHASLVFARVEGAGARQAFGGRAVGVVIAFISHHHLTYAAALTFLPDAHLLARAGSCFAYGLVAARLAETNDRHTRSTRSSVSKNLNLVVPAFMKVGVALRGRLVSRGAVVAAVAVAAAVVATFVLLLASALTTLALPFVTR